MLPPKNAFSISSCPLLMCSARAMVSTRYCRRTRTSSSQLLQQEANTVQFQRMETTTFSFTTSSFIERS